MLFQVLINLSILFNIIMFFGVIYLLKSRISIIPNKVKTLFKWKPLITSSKLINLFKWKIYLTPDKLKNPFKKKKNKTNNLLDRFSTLEQSILNANKEIFNLNKETKESLSILATNASSKDKEIERLREGYDTKILKKFIKKFLKVHQMIEDDLEFYKEKENDEITSCLNNIKEIFDDAILECDIEIFSPKKGENYKDAFGVSENLTRVDTNIKEDNMKIASTKKKGFKLSNNGKFEIIKPAIVSVYKYKKGA